MAIQLAIDKCHWPGIYASLEARRLKSSGSSVAAIKTATKFI